MYLTVHHPRTNPSFSAPRGKIFRSYSEPVKIHL